MFLSCNLHHGCLCVLVLPAVVLLLVLHQKLQLLLLLLSLLAVVRTASRTKGYGIHDTHISEPGSPNRDASEATSPGTALGM